MLIQQITVLVSIFCTRTVAGLKCLYCQDVTHPQFCKTIVTCGTGEVCGIEKFVSRGGDVRYALDCMANEVCLNHGSNITVRSVHNVENIRKCLHCCNGDLCNSGGCGESGFKELGASVCYECQHELGQEYCSTIGTCNRDQICYVQEVQRFSGTYISKGCRNRTLCDVMQNTGEVLGRKRRDILCERCCDGFLCNEGCGKDPCSDQPECFTLISNNQACKDERTAAQICPKSCGKCHTETTTPTLTSVCKDKSSNCGFLQSRFQICNDKSSIDQLGCHRTCGLCGQVTHSPGIPIDIPSQIFYLVFTINSRDAADLILYVVSKGTGHFNVTIPHLSKDNTIQITSKLIKYNISSLLLPGVFVKENKGILVKSSVPVHVYAWNGASHSSDGFQVLPLSQLSRGYLVPSSIPSSTSSDHRSQIAVVSTADNNSIQIGLKTVGSLSYNGKSYTNGESINIQLNKLETFDIAHIYSLTGTKITATEPVAVFSGNICNEFENIGCSHLVDMVPPMNSFDTAFIIPQIETQDTKVQVVAGKNDTNVNVTSGTTQNRHLQNAGDTTEKDLYSAAVVTSQNGILVTQFVFKGNFAPSMIIVPGINQYLSKYRFAVVSGPQNDTFSNYITVTIKGSEVNGLILDGNRLAHTKSSSVLIGNVSYVCFTTSITSGVHEIYHERDVTFGVFVYGKRSFDSYAYAADKLIKSNIP